MNNITNYGSSSESDSEEDDSLAFKRQKLQNLKESKEPTYIKKTINKPTSDSNSISSYLQEPKNANIKNYNTKTVKNLGGAVSNQFNGESIINNRELPTIKSSLTNTSFLPSSLLRKKKNKSKESASTIDNDIIIPKNLNANNVEFHYTSIDSIPKPVIIDAITKNPIIQDPEPVPVDIPKNSKIIEFNVGQFYNENDQTGTSSNPDSQPLKAFNAYGKNQLSSLIKYSTDEKTSKALENKFQAEREKKNATRKRYGW